MNKWNLIYWPKELIFWILIMSMTAIGSIAMWCSYGIDVLPVLGLLGGTVGLVIMLLHYPREGEVREFYNTKSIAKTETHPNGTKYIVNTYETYKKIYIKGVWVDVAE